MKFLFPLLVALLAVFAIAPLGYPGAFQSHTGLIAYYNLIDLDQHPALGWAPTIGNSFDLFRTEGPLPYLVAEFFHLFRFDYLNSIKLVYALAWIAAGLCMFALARRWMSEPGALLASIVYTYFPFHIATIYVRGAFAEAFAWALFPLATLVASRQSSDVSRQTFAFLLLIFALLFLTQPGIAVLFALFAFAATIALQPSYFRLSSSVLRLSGMIFGGLMIGGLFYLPTLLRFGANITRDGFNVNFAHPFQLFSSLWGFGMSTGSFLDQFPFQLGVAPIGLAIIAVALAKNRHDTRRVVFVFLAAAIVLSLLTFEITAPLWKLLGVFVAYPWQLLAFVGLALAIVAGSVIELDTRFARPAMLAFFVALPVVASYSLLAPRFIDVNPSRTSIATLGNNEIALWDYRIVGPLRHGATLRVQFTWQALRPVDYDYTIFLHAVHVDRGTFGEDDSKPADSTLKWTPGQVMTSTHTIQIDVDGPTEGYHLEFGMYNAATGQRALTATGADHINLPRPGDPEPIISEQLPLK